MILGKYSARELELLGTIIYLEKNEPASDISLIEKIQIIKPYFTESEISCAEKELGKIRPESSY